MVGKIKPVLKPCPFCGDEGIVEMDESWYWEFEAHCTKCTVTLGHFESESEAAKAWNSRKYVKEQ